jgi:hypothetical protein
MTCEGRIADGLLRMEMWAKRYEFAECSSERFLDKEHGEDGRRISNGWNAGDWACLGRYEQLGE